jgi:hypothetical protein
VGSISGEEKLMQEAKAARIGRAVLGFPLLRHFCHSEPQFEIGAARAVYKIEARELFGPMRLFGDQMRDGRCRQFGLKTEFAGTVTA